VGLKGYATSLTACLDGTPVTAKLVIGAYHRLFDTDPPRSGTTSATR
jgi:hypothetical protein